MRAVVLRSLAVVGIGALLLAAVLYVASTVDARAPEVVEIRLTQTSPAESDRALITTSIEVAFNERVDPESAVEAVEVQPSVDGSVSWSGSTMIFTPSDPLALESEYRVVVADGVRDLVGNEMVELPPPLEFTTVGPPSLADSEPADGAEDVPVDATILLTFSGLMDTDSVEDALRLQPPFPHELRWSGEQLEIEPDAPLDPGRRYRVRIQRGATDIAGVEISRPISLGFRTVRAGLGVDTVVPADGVAGIAPITPIAILFDRPIDPDSVDADLLAVVPDVGGSLELLTTAGQPARDDEPGSVLRFTPSGPLPPNTTFDVTLEPGLVAASGGGIAEALTWSFTTGAPTATLSNQIAFLSDRSGVTNVWAMNADGTGQHQLTAELTPITDYAVAPDGTSVTATDGRRLVFLRPDGADRRILTPEGAFDVDPTYAPSAELLAFARFDAETREPLGLFEWQVGGGDPEPVELPDDDGTATPGPEATSTASGTPIAPLRAPRYSPDGRALAFVDLDGHVGILQLPDERLTRVAFDAGAPPVWLPDSSGVLLAAGSPPEMTDDGIPPLADGDALALLPRSGRSVADAAVGGSRVLAVAADGRVAVLASDGRLRIADDQEEAATLTAALPAEPVVGAAFSPADGALLLVALPDDGLHLVDLDSGQRTELAASGWLPHWLP